jgi:hypothetical protein
MNLPENFEEAVVQYFNRILLLIGITIANSHSISIEGVIDDLLTPSFIESAGLYMVGQFICG